MVYRVSGPAIHVQNVSFDGAGSAELPALEAAAAKLKGMDYSLETIQVRSAKDLLPVYQERGYLKAVLGDPIPKIAQDSPQETLVDVTFPVKPGRQYRLESLELRGCKAVAADDLRGVMKSRPGGVANQVQLSSDVEAIKKMYQTNGYMAAEVQPMPEFKEEESAVKYIVQIKEGDLYKMGELDIFGLDGRTTARLEEQWKIRGGDAFKGDYPALFIQEALKELSLMGSWKAGMHLGVNHKDKTVDVSLRFDPDDRR
jgi:outer membrane protein assembly factor BamA